MGRRSSFVRRAQDKYFTPEKALLPLLPHLNRVERFIEPCAGDGRLVRYLEARGHICLDAFDIAPEHESVRQADALHVLGPSEAICITNPPWTREILHPLIDHWRVQMPTWFLFDAEWAHTKQASPYLPYCHKIVSVGRVKWIEDSPYQGKDSAAWYLLDSVRTQTRFYGR
jgi:hypothetical protein